MALYHVKLTKVADKGTVPAHRIFEGYTVLGYSGPPILGEPFTVLRYERNGVHLPGVMNTTTVTESRLFLGKESKHWEFETANSRYRLDILPDLPADSPAQ